MITEDIKDLARDKVYSIYSNKAIKMNDKDPYWKVSDESKADCIASDERDLAAWNYIYGLIEKDNKL